MNWVVILLCIFRIVIEFGVYSLLARFQNLSANGRHRIALCLHSLHKNRTVTACHEISTPIWISFRRRVDERTDLIFECLIDNDFIISGRHSRPPHPTKTLRPLTEAFSAAAEIRAYASPTAGLSYWPQIPMLVKVSTCKMRSGRRGILVSQVEGTHKQHVNSVYSCDFPT